MKKLLVACVAVLTMIVSASAAEKITIAIMDFQAQDVPRAEALKISELIRNEMVNSGRYTVLERAQVGKILKEQGFQMTGCTDVTCAVQVGKLLSARKILVGSVMKFGDNMAVTGRVVDVEKGIAEFAEKERTVFKGDLFYMVERFCDKLTLRITGKPLYKDEELPAYGGVKRKTNYKPIKDPTAWLALGAGIATGTGFILAYDRYSRKEPKLDSRDLSDFLKSIAVWSWSSGDPVGWGLSLILITNQMNNAREHWKAVRNTHYYINAGIGGFSIIMLATFLGRCVYNKYAVNDSPSTSSIAVFVPPQYFDPVDWINGKPGFGLGMSMRF